MTNLDWSQCAVKTINDVVDTSMDTGQKTPVLARLNVLSIPPLASSMTKIASNASGPGEAPINNRGGQDRRHRKRGETPSATGSPIIVHPTREKMP